MSGRGGRLLAASLVLNVCLTGFLAARLYHAHLAHTERPTIEAVLSGIQAKLSRDDAARFIEPFERDRVKLQTSQSELESARAAVWKAIAAEPFDADAARRAIDVWRQKSSDNAKHFVDALADAVQAISTEGRATVIRTLEEQQPTFASHRSPDAK
jgi:uncharacterized membrane protein